MPNGEFEVLFEGRCQCGDEGLDWGWDDDEMSFCAECTCFKRHKLTPLTADFTIELNGDEEDLAEEEENWK